MRIVNKSQTKMRPKIGFFILGQVLDNVANKAGVS